MGKFFFGYPLFGFFRVWKTFKKAEMAKTLSNGLSMVETNPPQPQMVGFHDLDGVGIAPVSKKNAVKWSHL